MESRQIRHRRGKNQAVVVAPPAPTLMCAKNLPRRGARWAISKNEARTRPTTTPTRRPPMLREDWEPPGRPQRGPGRSNLDLQTRPEPARGEAWPLSAEIEGAPQNLEARAPDAHRHRCSTLLGRRTKTRTKGPINARPKQ